MKKINLDDLSDEQKLELLRELGEDLGESPESAVQDMAIEGEITFRVLDDDGDEKTVETEEFKY